MGEQGLTFNEIAVLVGVDLAAFEPINDLWRIIDLGPDPDARLLLANGERGSAASERVEHKFSRDRGHLYHPIESLCRKGIRLPILGFELPMANRRNVRPYVLEVHSFWIHRVAMAAVILDFAAAMPTCLDWRPDASERLRLALRVVKEAVVTRVQPSRNREASGHLDGDPVPEVHPERG